MIPRLSARTRPFAADTRGVALLEFAFAFPVVLALGLYGIEVANLALANMKVSQIALAVADNASRLGDVSALRTKQLSERDINDVFEAARSQGRSFDLVARGRVTISSLEESGGRQVLHWQRCLGAKQGTNYDSSYGAASATDGSDTQPANDGVVMPAAGMGPAGRMVAAPPGTGVIFVEINYDYKPLVGSLWTPTRRLHYIATMIVRDRRDFSQIFNPAPGATRMSCDQPRT